MTSGSWRLGWHRSLRSLSSAARHRGPRYGQLVVPVQTPLLTAQEPVAKQIWHQFYRAADGTVPKNQMLVVRFLETLFRTEKEFDAVKANLTDGANEEALQAWKAALSKLKNRRLQLKEQLEFKSVEQRLSAQPIVDVLLKNLKDEAVFMEYFAEIEEHPILIEATPMLTLELCNNGMINEALQLVLKLDERFASKEYAVHRSHALSNAINVLLYRYLDTNRSFDAIHLLQSLNIPGSSIYLTTAVAQKLKYTSESALIEMYKTLLGKGISMRLTSMEGFLKKTFQSSNEARELLCQTDRAHQQLNSDAELAFTPTMYRYMIQQLVKWRDNVRAKWLLENAWPRTGQNDEWNLLIYEAIKLGQFSSTTSVREFLAANKIRPRRSLLQVLMTGFREAAMPEKCFECIDIMKENRQPLDKKACTQLLAVLNDRYDPVVLMNYFRIMYSEYSSLLEDLGITQYMDSRGVTIDDVQLPGSLKISQEDIKPHGGQCFRTPEPSLTVLYNSVLNSVESLSTLRMLFEKYIDYASKLKGRYDRPSLRIVDAFVRHMCKRFQTKTSINLAHDLFDRALKEIKFHKQPEYMPHTPLLLTFHHAADIKTLGGESLAYPANIHRAIEAVQTFENHRLLFPVRGNTYEPLIKYYIKEGDLIQAKRWEDHANSLGALVTFPELHPDDQSI